jgi:pimeloyl-CoA synthetase
MFKKKIIDIDGDAIRKKTRILFIDDQSRKDIVDYLKEEGWIARAINDIKAIDTTDINDSHIICVDIKGVGVKLNKENEGLDIAASIKKRYPYKKVILYSSQATHDIFHEANNLVDRRIHKSSGDYEIFRNEIEELSKDIFNWSNMSISSYNVIKNQLPSEITFDKYQKILQKILRERNISEGIIGKYLPIAANAAQVLSLILQIFKS